MKLAPTAPRIIDTPSMRLHSEPGFFVLVTNGTLRAHAEQLRNLALLNEVAVLHGHKARLQYAAATAYEMDARPARALGWIADGALTTTKETP